MLKWVPECLSPAFLKSAKQIRILHHSWCQLLIGSVPVPPGGTLTKESLRIMTGFDYYLSNLRAGNSLATCS